jgi:hypothetical protein
MKKKRIGCSIKRPKQGLTSSIPLTYIPRGAEGGGAEIIVGRWLSNKRSGFILGTKGGEKMGPAAWVQAAHENTCSTPSMLRYAA